MLSIYENSKLYSHPKNEFKAFKHTEDIKVKLLILIQSEIEIGVELIEMLDKILLALKIDQSEAEIIVFSKGIFAAQIINQYEAPNVLVFGATCSDLQLNMYLNKFKVYAINNFNILLVNDILDVYSNKNLKAKLWAQLQTMI